MLCKYAEKSIQKRLEPSNFQFFFFNHSKCGFYVTIFISTLAVANFQAYYLSVIWSFWSPCLWQLLIGNNNYWVCVTTCKILIFFKSGWMRMKWAVLFGIRPKYFFLGGGGEEGQVLQKLWIIWYFNWVDNINLATVKSF